MSKTTNSHLERQIAAQRKKKIVVGIQYALAIVITLIVIFPLYWMISSSVKSLDDFFIREISG